MKMMDVDGNIIDLGDPPQLELSGEDIEEVLEFGRRFCTVRVTEEVRDPKEES